MKPLLSLLLSGVLTMGAPLHQPAEEPATAHADTHYEVHMITPMFTSLQLEYVKPYTSSYKIYRANNGNNVLLGELNDQLEFVTVQGNTLLKRSQHTSIDNTTISNSSFSSWPALTPNMSISTLDDEVLMLYYHNDAVVGELIAPDGSTTEILERVDALYFDSHLIDIVASSLPLELNYKATFMGFDPMSKERTPNHLVAVTDRIPISIQHKTFDTWVVSLVSGNKHHLLYIDAIDRSVVKMVVPDKHQYLIFERNV